MQLFYNPNITNQEKSFAFDKEESKHIIKVLRKKEGDILHVTNGLGFLFNTKIALASDSKCTVNILSFEKQKPRRGHSGVRWISRTDPPRSSCDAPPPRCPPRGTPRHRPRSRSTRSPRPREEPRAFGNNRLRHPARRTTWHDSRPLNRFPANQHSRRIRHRHRDRRGSLRKSPHFGRRPHGRHPGLCRPQLHFRPCE